MFPWMKCNVMFILPQIRGIDTQNKIAWLGILRKEISITNRSFPAHSRPFSLLLISFPSQALLCSPWALPWTVKPNIGSSSWRIPISTTALCLAPSCRSRFGFHSRVFARHGSAITLAELYSTWFLGSCGASISITWSGTFMSLKVDMYIFL